MVAYSSIEICNLALSALGDDKGITGFPPTDSSKAARLCSLHYEKTLAELLREAPWPFATKHVALALVAEADAQPWATEWAYQYRYPADCSRIIAILSGVRRSPLPLAFELGSDGTGKVIYADEEDAVISYAAELTDTTLFPADFCEALVARLAARIAFALTGRVEARDGAQADAERAVSKAKASGRTERTPDVEPDAEWIRARS